MKLLKHYAEKGKNIFCTALSTLVKEPTFKSRSHFEGIFRPRKQRVSALCINDKNKKSQIGMHITLFAVHSNEMQTHAGIMVIVIPWFVRIYEEIIHEI